MNGKRKKAPHLDPKILSTLLSAEDARDLVDIHVLASLWAGYGSILRLEFKTVQSRVVKLIMPPALPSLSSSSISNDDGTNGNGNSNGIAYDEGRARKILSYQVEANFYKHFAPIATQAGATVPKLWKASTLEMPLGSSSSETVEAQVLVLQDLRNEFPVFAENRGTLSRQQIYVSLEWLARFHAAFWDVESRHGLRLPQHDQTQSQSDGDGTSSWCPTPHLATLSSWAGTGLWLQGGYHYLSTRLEELRDISSSWSSLGLNDTSDLPFAVDWCLNNPPNRRRLSLIHGDVKAANMAFTSSSPPKMAMYDFQYVGKGLGVQDLAKFLTTSVPESWLEGEGEKALLERYYECLVREKGRQNEYGFDELWEDWELALVSWTRFLAGWSGGFWGNVDWLQERTRTLLMDEGWTGRVLERYRRRAEK